MQHYLLVVQYIHNMLILGLDNLSSMILDNYNLPFHEPVELMLFEGVYFVQIRLN